MLEFGHLYVRFYKDYAPVLSAGIPYEVVTPYTEADLINDAGAFAIDYTQSGDILYLAHRRHQPVAVGRRGDGRPRARVGPRRPRDAGICARVQEAVRCRGNELHAVRRDFGEPGEGGMPCPEIVEHDAGAGGAEGGERAEGGFEITQGRLFCQLHA